MVERTRGAGDEEVYSCANRAAVVVAPTRWSAEQFGDHAVVAPEAVDPSLFSPAAAEGDEAEGCRCRHRDVRQETVGVDQEGTGFGQKGIGVDEERECLRSISTDNISR